MKVKDISSLEAYKLLLENKNALLVDVRTTKEWHEVGVPLLEERDEKLLQGSNYRLLFLSWRILPLMAINLEFSRQIIEQIIDKNKMLLFLCRSGGRSLEAAARVISLGCNNCYNITDGFEGGTNGLGWRKNNLPWRII